MMTTFACSATRVSRRAGAAGAGFPVMPSPGWAALVRGCCGCAPVSGRAAVAAVGALVLDPIVFGVIPAGPPVPGQLGAWFALAQWDWPAVPAPPQ